MAQPPHLIFFPLQPAQEAKNLAVEHLSQPMVFAWDHRGRKPTLAAIRAALLDIVSHLYRIDTVFFIFSPLLTSENLKACTTHSSSLQMPHGKPFWLPHSDSRFPTKPKQQSMWIRDIKARTLDMVLRNRMAVILLTSGNSGFCPQAHRTRDSVYDCGPRWHSKKSGTLTVTLH